MKAYQWILASLISILIFSAGFPFGNTPKEGNTVAVPDSGIILGRYVSDLSYEGKDLLLMDSDGNRVQWLARITGTSSWSRDGAKIAAGCGDDMNTLCIFDTSTIPDPTLYPPSLDPSINQMSVIKKINLPAGCKATFQKSPHSFSVSADRILSISWAPSGQQLAVVCGAPAPEQNKDVCIINLDDTDGRCWGNERNKGLTNVSWSPKEKLLVTGGIPGIDSKIMLTSIDGATEKFLTNGWSPVWSPDGKFIAYNSFIPIPNSRGGYQETRIGVIDKDGKNNRWLYESRPDETIYGGLFLQGCNYNYGACRLSWSPDGKYLVFVSSILSEYNYTLFRLDIRTKKIIRLLDPSVYKNQIVEPDWGRWSRKKQP